MDPSLESSHTFKTHRKIQKHQLRVPTVTSYLDLDYIDALEALYIFTISCLIDSTVGYVVDYFANLFHTILVACSKS